MSIDFFTEDNNFALGNTESILSNPSSKQFSVLGEFLPADGLSQPNNAAFSEIISSSRLIDIQSSHDLNSDSEMKTGLISRAAAASLVFIDPTVSDYQHLAANVLEGTEIFTLDPLRDGVEQISEILTEYGDISSLHIVSHGSPGNLHLGTAELNFKTIENYGTALQKWGNALTDTADILIYGCDVAADENGRTFVQQLSTLSGADITASSDRTGSAALGGNWDFEFTTGAIETDLAFKPKLMETYDAVFQKPIRIEAEDMALSGYGVESASVASNRNSISLKYRGNTGTASTAFAGSAGTYNVVVGCYDENDGVAQLSVKADGKQIDFWNLDRDLGSDYISTGNLVKRTIANVSLKQGSKIEIQGTRDGGEYARVDFIDFIPVSPDPKPPVNNGPVRAFPGAEGFGANAKGGRGGDVLFVDNLNDSGPGSLRAALEASGSRTVVFRTGGTITLKSGIVIENPYLTIAGQTAPGDGIAIRLANNTPDTSPIIIATHDVVMRHLRIRSGIPSVSPDATDSGNNNIMIWGNESHDIIIDHSSLSWAIDQVMGVWAGGNKITVQNSIISEGLNNSKHPKGTHSRGPIVGGGSDKVTFYKNLMAHNKGRNPIFNIDDTDNITINAQVVNNLIYNWGHMGTEIQPSEANGTIKANIVGNYYKPGYDSENYEITVGGPGTAKMYVKGNIGPHRSNNSMNEWANVGYWDIKAWEKTGNGYTGDPAPTSYQVTTPHDMPVIPTVSAFDAYNDVLENAGATKPGRDAVDKRIVNDVKNGTGRIIDNPSQVGGWPTLANGTPPADTDKDGMPDAWETKNGFNSNNPDDRNGDTDGDGYTNLEEYLNSIA
jgi:hypothetical protein